jgi:hypothetical protein
MSVIIAILYVVAASIVVSVAVGAFVRTRLVVVTGSLVITELIFLILEYRSIASSSDAPEVFLLPIWLTIVIAPIILITSLGSMTVKARVMGAKTAP